LEKQETTYTRAEAGDWNASQKFAGVALKDLVGGGVTPNISMHLVKIEPGCEIAPHVHETNRETFHMLEGKGAILVNGEWKPWEAGDSATVPAGHKHGMKNAGDKTMLFLAIYTPAIG